MKPFFILNVSFTATLNHYKAHLTESIKLHIWIKKKKKKKALLTAGPFFYFIFHTNVHISMNFYLFDKKLVSFSLDMNTI